MAKVTQAQVEEQGDVISLDPETFAGGFAGDDVDVDWTDCSWVLFNYAGKRTENELAFRVQGVTEDGQRMDQHYTAGKTALENFVPTEDGKGLKKVGTKSVMPTGSNFSLLMTSLINAGFPRDRLARGRADSMDNLRVHMKSVPQPERKGLLNPATAPGGGPKTILVVQKIIHLPEQKRVMFKAALSPAGVAVGTGPAAMAPQVGTSAPAATPQADDGGEAETNAVNAVLEILVASDGQIAKGKLTGEIFKRFKDASQRKAVLDYAFDDAWLTSRDEWTYANGIVKLG